MSAFLTLLQEFTTTREFDYELMTAYCLLKKGYNNEGEMARGFKGLPRPPWDGLSLPVALKNDVMTGPAVASLSGGFLRF